MMGRFRGGCASPAAGCIDHLNRSGFRADSGVPRSRRCRNVMAGRRSLSGMLSIALMREETTMSVTAMVQDWMLGLGNRENAAVRSRAHIAAETSQNLDAICATVATDPFFVVPTRTGDGYQIDSTNVLTTDDLVRGYYGGRMGGYVIVASRQLKSFASDWYVFNDTVASVRGTGMVGGVDATDQQYAVQAAVLFPAASNGIRGEIAVGRYAYADSMR